MRTLVLAVLVACSRSESAPGTDPKAMTPTTPTTRISELSPRRGATRLVVAKDRVAFLDRDRIVFTPLADKPRVATPIADAHALGLVGDDVVVATTALGKSAIVRFAPGDTKGHPLDGIMAVPSTGYGSIFAAGKPNELFIGGPHTGLNRCRIDPDRVVPIQAVDWKADEDATFSSAGRGRVAFAQSGVIVRIGADGAREAFKLPATLPTPVHLAPGPTDDSMWFTGRDELGLLELAHDEAKLVRTVALGALAFDLASAGDAAAVITAKGNAARFTSEIQVVGADGKVRWHAALPANAPNMFVAGSADRVAVALGNDLLVWNARDGAAIPLRAP